MAMHGSVENFNPAEDDWSTYTERLEHYFHANSVTDAGKKASILLTFCGKPTYKLLRSLVPDNKLEGVSYENLVILLKDHYHPAPSAIVQRYHFNSRTRKPNESIAEYVAALRDLARHCDYGDKLAEMLRDRIVCGVNHRGIQRRLLAESALTYETAFKLAQAVEASEKETKLLAGNKSEVPLHTEKELNYTRTSSRPKGDQISCYRCGGPHLATHCRHKDVICHCCKKKGHFARVCKSKDRQKTLSHSAHLEAAKNKKPLKPTPTHFMDEEQIESSSSLESEYDVHVLSGKRSDPYILDVVLMGYQSKWNSIQEQLYL